MSDNDQSKEKNSGGAGMSQDQVQETGRRRLLAALGLGSAALIPTAWRTPDVQGMILPSHADVSPPSGSITENPGTSKSFFVELTPDDAAGTKKG